MSASLAQLQSKKNIFGMVLAGGKSTRMGEDKRFLCLDKNITLLDNTIKKLSQVLNQKEENILVSGFIPDRLCIADEKTGYGPLMGLYSVLRYLTEKKNLREGVLLVLPVDMPCISEKLLKELVLFHEKNKLHGDISWVHSKALPLCVNFDKYILQKLKNYVQTTEKSHRSFRGLSGLLKANIYTPKYCVESELKNLNTMKEWREALRHQSFLSHQAG